MVDIKLIKNIKSYIKANYSKPKKERVFSSRVKMAKQSYVNNDFINYEGVSFNIDLNVKQTWQQSVFNFIDSKGYKDPEVYKRANLSKQTFSKIRCDENYQPNKDTAIQICIGLKLNMDETLDLLAKAGYTLSHSLKRDLVVKYFISENIYNVDELNLVLDELKLKLFPIN